MCMNKDGVRGRKRGLCGQGGALCGQGGALRRVPKINDLPPS